jgi:hypothetical protein
MDPIAVTALDVAKGLSNGPANDALRLTYG